MISLTSLGKNFFPLPNFGFFVPQGRTRVATDLNPWLGGRHGLKPEAIFRPPLRGDEASLGSTISWISSSA